MDLAKLEKSIPLRAIPEKDLDSLLGNQFLIWLSDLLSLTDENSADKLISALPAIKKQCWSMGFMEIKKMFEMYADNQLSIKPIPNYFDRILLGKILEAYKQQKPANKPEPVEVVVSDEEKENLIFMGVVNAFEQYMQDGEIIVGYTWVYGHLIDDLKIHAFTKEEKLSAMERAKKKTRREGMLASMMEADIEISIKNEAKRILLGDWFRCIIEEKKHIKDFL